MIIQKEVFVGCVGVHADGCGFQGAVGSGDKAANQLSHSFSFLGVHGSTDDIGLSVFAFVMDGNFYALAKIGKSVEKTVWRVLPNMDGTVAREKLFVVGFRLKPKKNLALD